MQGLNRWHWVIFYYPVRYYSELPPQIPTHFSLTGEPDFWSEKNLGELLLVPLLILTGAVLLLPLVCWMNTVKDPRQILSLPGKKVSEIPFLTYALEESGENMPVVDILPERRNNVED